MITININIAHSYARIYAYTRCGCGCGSKFRTGIGSKFGNINITGKPYEPDGDTVISVGIGIS